MYSDLFDALGGGGGGGNHRSSNTTSRPEPESLISFKAGKCELALQENGKYMVNPDTRRGQVNLRYNDNDELLWEWYDRREKRTVDSIVLKEAIQLTRAVVLPHKRQEDQDRVYYWKLDNEWKMIWLQDKEEDVELIGKVNELLKQPKKPDSTSATTPTATGNSSSSSTTFHRGGGATMAPSPGNASTSSSSTSRQVDALSSILENLGMPQGDSVSSTSSTGAGGGATGVGGGTLTLADLQGAMAGLQQHQRSGAPVGLQDIVTAQAITDLLANEGVRNRLLQELPEEQRTPEYLEDNLRSPQVQQTLRSLTSALLPDDNGSLDGYHSVIANFQLDAEAGQRALAESNNPIQAFLDCILASVQKENSKEGEGEGATTKEEEEEDSEMKED